MSVTYSMACMVPKFLPLATSCVRGKFACALNLAIKPWSFGHERVPLKFFVAAVGQLRKLQTLARPLLRIVRPMLRAPVSQKDIRAVLAI